MEFLYHVGVQKSIVFGTVEAVPFGVRKFKVFSRAEWRGFRNMLVKWRSRAEETVARAKAERVVERSNRDVRTGRDAWWSLTIRCAVDVRTIGRHKYKETWEAPCAKSRKTGYCVEFIGSPRDREFSQLRIDEMTLCSKLYSK
jgi:hypothetical protein